MVFVIEHCRKFGILLIPHEGPGWFPAEELKAHYGLADERKDTMVEKSLLGYRSDGREGLFVPTLPRIETAVSFKPGTPSDVESPAMEPKETNNSVKKDKE